MQAYLQDEKPQEAKDRVKVALQKPSLSLDELDSFGGTSLFAAKSSGTRQDVSLSPIQ